MAEVEFERRLERLFTDAPELADAGAFGDRVERRLDRGWTARRTLIGVAGVAGGVIGASQLIMSNFFDRMEGASKGSARALEIGFNDIAPQANWLSLATSGGAVVWIAAGMAILLMAFALSRVIEEI